MKFLTLLSFLLLIAIQSMAQANQDKLYYAQKVEKYTRMKHNGTTLTVTGGILVVVGLSMILNGGHSSYQSSSGTSQSTLSRSQENGVLVYYLGAVSLGAGIPLWIVGGHQQRKYEEKFQRLSLGFNLNPQRKGLTLTYRF